MAVLGTLGVIYVSKSPFEVLMNSLAVSFVSRLDDDIVSENDLKRALNRLKNHPKGKYKVAYENQSNGFVLALLMPLNIVGFIGLFVTLASPLFAPAYLMVCM